MNKSRLAEVLGVERGEIFGIETYAAQFYINEVDVFVSTKDPIELTPRGELIALCRVLNGDLKIIREPRFSDEEMMVLRLLHKYGNATRIYKSNNGTYACTSNGKLMIDNIGKLLKTGEEVNLDKMFGGDA